MRKKTLRVLSSLMCLFFLASLFQAPLMAAAQSIPVRVGNQVLNVTPGQWVSVRSGTQITHYNVRFIDGKPVALEMSQYTKLVFGEAGVSGAAGSAADDVAQATSGSSASGKTSAGSSQTSQSSQSSQNTGTQSGSGASAGSVADDVAQAGSAGSAGSLADDVAQAGSAGSVADDVAQVTSGGPSQSQVSKSSGSTGGMQQYRTAYQFFSAHLSG